jgi:hypothetical protein
MQRGDIRARLGKAADLTAVDCKQPMMQALPDLPDPMTSFSALCSVSFGQLSRQSRPGLVRLFGNNGFDRADIEATRVKHQVVICGLIIACIFHILNAIYDNAAVSETLFLSYPFSRSFHIFTPFFFTVLI